jgi:hypothetical protein
MLKISSAHEAKEIEINLKQCFTKEKLVKSKDKISKT